MKKWIYRILLIMCIAVFGYSAFHLYSIYSDKHEIEQETENYKKIAVKNNRMLDPDWNALQKQNPDIVGWIYVPGCDISFPVVQGTDNSYYLTHSTDRADSPYGAVFLDANANAGFLDDNSIIYGHSIEGGGMFTDLKKYSNEDFFKKHSKFYLLTPEQNYICHVYTYEKTTDTSVYYTTDFGDFRDDTINDWADKALYRNDIDLTDKNFVSLSTCNLDYGFNSNQRYVLTGALEKTNQDIVLEDE